MAPPLLTSYGLSLLPVDCFAPLARRRGSIWLDSSLTRNDRGRYSYLAARPVGEIRLARGRTEVVDSRGGVRQYDRDEFVGELEKIRLSNDLTAIGFISYEATLPWLGLSPSYSQETPDAHFFVYDRLHRYDNLTGEYSDTDLATQLHETDTYRESDTSVEPPTEPAITPYLTRDEYLNLVAIIKHDIREGDIYQANLTSRFDVRYGLGPFAAYLRLRRLNPCWYGGFLNFGDYQVLSSSPERMLLWQNDRIVSSPIKGTIARGRDADETERNLQALLHSEKDRAELVMIVDLVRNDLGKFARTGSVRVDNLCRTEVHSSLIHLVADVSAETEPGCTLAEVLRALLPGGSITGCPKRRAVEILRELEVSPRSVYTGCIGYVGSGRAEFNIAIRTMVHRNGIFRIHAGGGIVADSDPEAEYAELLLKARNLFHSLGVTL
ncbi:MAG: anthranilate synthase component I family protein [Candidatus Zixiibacteriota bacterium]